MLFFLTAMLYTKMGKENDENRSSINFCSILMLSRHALEPVVWRPSR